MGSFVKNSLIVLTKVLLFSIPSITLLPIDCPHHKANQHNFIDGRAPLFVGDEVDFGNRAPQMNFALDHKSCPLSWFHRRRKHVVNNKPDALSYPKQMHNVLLFVLQLLLVLKSVNVASSWTPTSDFLPTICRVAELLVGCNFVDSIIYLIILQL